MQLQKAWLHHLYFPHQVFTSIDEIPPKPSLLLAEQSQLSQCLLMGEMLQSLNYLSGSLLDSFWYAHVFFLLGTPELDTALQVL